MAPDPNDEIERNTVEARQGTTRPMLIYVLGAGCALVVVLFAIVWLFQGHH